MSSPRRQPSNISSVILEAAFLFLCFFDRNLWFLTRSGDDFFRDLRVQVPLYYLLLAFLVSSSHPFTLPSATDPLRFVGFCPFVLELLDRLSQWLAMLHCGLAQRCIWPCTLLVDVAWSTSMPFDYFALCCFLGLRRPIFLHCHGRVWWNQEEQEAPACCHSWTWFVVPFLPTNRFSCRRCGDVFHRLNPVCSRGRVKSTCACETPFVPRFAFRLCQPQRKFSGPPRSIPFVW